MASKKQTDKKKTGNALKKAPNSAPKRRQEAEVKTPSRVRDIVMLVMIAVAVLIAVSVYSPAIPWLNQGCYFLFGIVMYALPVLIVVFMLAFLYHEKNGAFYRRLIAFILFWFALSGIFSFAAGKEAGGLLGRLNRLMFEGWLGNAGAYVVNGLIITIAVVLVIDFSFFTYAETQRRRLRDRRKEQRAIRENEKAMEADEQYARRKNEERELKDTLSRREALKVRQEEKDRKADENRERFQPKFGIGNTLITDDSPDVNTTFYQGSEAFTENAHLFNSYKNSGRKTKEENPEDTSFIPSITFSDPSASIGRDDKPFESDDPDDDYTKVVVTNTAKPHRLSADPAKPESETEVIELHKPEKKLPQEGKKEYKMPPITLLERGKPMQASQNEMRDELERNKELLENTLEMYRAPGTVTNIVAGPTVTRYEVQPLQGVKVSKIQNLQNDLKYALAATDIRIEAPIPGKSAVGIEVPNRSKAPVLLRNLLESQEFRNAKSNLAYGLGMDIDGKIIISDLQKMPHLLVAGTTGSGKSVCLNTMIISILYHAKPTDVKMILIDPKMIEFSGYNGIPHLLMPVVTDAKKASMALAWAVQEMEKRYETFLKYSVRDITGFNQYIELEQPEDDMGQPVKRMPQILIVVDEFADMMMVAAKEVENSVTRLAQKARAAGIHLVLATQSPRANVITGLIKANIPSRIALSVSSELESRIVLDMPGAETMTGHGDMLYAPQGISKPVRLQGAYVKDDEIKAVVEYTKAEGSVKGGGVKDVDLTAPSSSGTGGNASGDGDELFAECGRFIIEKQKASIGLLQRAFQIGFNRAARIMDQLADAGVVGEEEGTKPRRIIMTLPEFEAMLSKKK